jgi:hypothetical protein
MHNLLFRYWLARCRGIDPDLDVGIALPAVPHPAQIVLGAISLKQATLPRDLPRLYRRRPPLANSTHSAHPTPRITGFVMAHRIT